MHRQAATFAMFCCVSAFGFWSPLIAATTSTVVSSSVSTRPALIAPSVEGKPVPRLMPAGFRFRTTYLPRGFTESKNAQAVWFSFGANTPSAREEPGFFRVWTRSGSGERPEFILAIAETSERSDFSIRPGGRRDATVDLRMRKGIDVYVSTASGCDIRWSERGVDVKITVLAPTVTPEEVKLLVAGVRLS